MIVSVVCSADYQMLTEMVLARNQRLGNLHCPADAEMDTDDDEDSVEKKNDALDIPYNYALDRTCSTGCDEEMRKALEEFATKVGVTQGTSTSFNFHALAHDNKVRKVATIRKLLEKITSILAPGAEEELGELIENSFNPSSKSNALEMKFRSLLQEVSIQYSKAADRHEREIVLATVVLSIPYSDISQYVRGLSAWKYRKAKVYALQNKRPEQSVTRRERYEPYKVNYFVTFICR